MKTTKLEGSKLIFILKIITQLDALKKKIYNHLYYNI